MAGVKSRSASAALSNANLDDALAIDGVGASFLMQSLGGSAPYEQQFRELARNSMEVMVGGSVQVTFGKVQRNGAWKIALTDNGCGMTRAELLTRFKLASSGKDQSLYANFGIGAKITGGCRNPAGLEVISMTEDDGSAWRIRMHYVGNQYDLVKFGKESCERVPEAEVPQDILNAGHGTQVVLWGDTPAEDSVATLIARMKTKGLTRYLNSRFYTIPSGVTLKTLLETNTRWGRRIVGQEKLLTQAAEASGTVSLDGGAVTWFIASEAAVAAARDEGEVAGFVGTLYQGELYSRAEGRGGLQALRTFGISAGTSRVALIVEPDDVKSNPTRTGLTTLDDRDFSYAELAEQFRNNLPDAIITFLENEEAKNETNRSDMVAGRMNKIALLFKLVGRRGGSSAGSSTATSTSSSGGDDKTKPKPGPKRKPSNPPASAGVDMELPTFRWVKASYPGWGGLVNRAADYDSINNKMLLNKDFSPFVTLIEAIVDEVAGDRPQLRKQVRNYAEKKAQIWVETQVAEAVLNVRTLATASGWTQAQADALLSPDVLSLVVSARYFTVSEVRKAARGAFH